MNSGVTNSGLHELLANEPYRVSFFQAVRLLHRLNSGAARVGGFGDPALEAVRFHAHASLSFPASEIQTLDFPADFRVDDQPPVSSYHHTFAKWQSSRCGRQ